MRFKNLLTALTGAILLAVSLPIPASAASPTMSKRTLHWQSGSPLQEVFGFFGDTMLMVLLVNVSDREVTQTVVGLVLEDGSSAVQATTQSGRVCRANVLPGGFLVVTEAHNGFDQAASYFRDKGITRKEVTSGVTQVRFADGSEWTYPLERKGRFVEQADDKLGQKIDALIKEQFGDKDLLSGLAAARMNPFKRKNVSTCR